MTTPPSVDASRFCRVCAFVLVALVVGVIVLLVFVLNPAPPPDYSKIPIVADTNWDSVTGGGWSYLQRTGDRPAAVVVDASAPISPQNVLSIDFTGTNQDTEPGVHFHALPQVREVYAEWWLKFSANWTCAPAGCGKLAFIFPPMGGDTYVGVYCGDGTELGGCAGDYLDTSRPMIVGGQLQFGPYGGTPILANVTRTTIVRDRWTHIAWYFKWSTTPTATDGIWRMWVDGVLNLERTDLAVSIDPGIEFQFAPTRQPVPPPDETLRIDHTIVRGQ